jgi:hypothetical protein
VWVRVTFGPARRAPDANAVDARGTAGPGAPVPPLTRSTAALIRRLLHACRDRWVRDARVERVAVAAVADARRAGASAAELARALRRTWADHLGVPRLVSQDARDLHNRLVTACVHELADDGATAAGAPPHRRKGA